MLVGMPLCFGGLSFHALCLLCGAPLLEEIVLRSGLQQALLTRCERRGDPRRFLMANLPAAIAFSAAHLVMRPGWPALATALPALLIGAVYERQRCLFPCVALHAAGNALWLGFAAASP